MIMVPYGWTPSVAAGHKNADLWHPTGSTPGRKSRQRNQSGPPLICGVSVLVSGL